MNPQATTSASVSYELIDVDGDENLLETPNSPDPLLLGSLNGKAPHHQGILEDDIGPRKLYHGSHTAALERKLQYPTSSRPARGEEAEDPIEVEEDSAEDEPSTSRRTLSATQIRPGIVKRVVSDIEKKPKAPHVDLRHPPATRKQQNIKTRMAVRVSILHI
jgi:hypothetical protein